VSECGGVTAAAPGVPNIQPVKPATKKKTMSAIVATAKLRSARRDRSHPFIDCLAFILICSRVSVSDRSDNAHAPSRLDHPLALALKHDELDERGHLVEPAEEPDEKDDRDGYTDQPQQKTSTHSFLLYRWFPHLTAALNLSSNRCQGREYRCAVAA
jgi:hypothetical protein